MTWVKGYELVTMIGVEGSGSQTLQCAHGNRSMRRRHCSRGYFLAGLGFTQVFDADHYDKDFRHSIHSSEPARKCLSQDARSKRNLRASACLCVFKVPHAQCIAVHLKGPAIPTNVANLENTTFGLDSAPQYYINCQTLGLLRILLSLSLLLLIINSTAQKPLFKILHTTLSTHHEAPVSGRSCFLDLATLLASNEAWKACYMNSLQLDHSSESQAMFLTSHLPRIWV